MRLHSLVAALAIVFGCTSMRNFVYGPAPQTSRPDAPGQIDGHASVTYPVPADHPRGEVQLAILRLTTVRVPDGRHRRTAQAAVVRAIVHNRDDDLWTIDCSAIDGVIDDSRHEYPFRAETDGQSAWTMVLEPGETRTVDLYYELPAKSDKPSIAVAWRVSTASGSILRTTTTSPARHEELRPSDARSSRQ